MFVIRSVITKSPCQSLTTRLLLCDGIQCCEICLLINCYNKYLNKLKVDFRHNLEVHLVSLFSDRSWAAA